MTYPTWTLQDRIRKAREHAGLKQEELATKLDVTRHTLGRWEKGDNIPSSAKLEAIALATGVPAEWFSTTDEASTPPTPPERIVLEWQGDSYELVAKERE